MDAYLGALDNVASDAGAEVVVGENFQRKPSSCKFHITVSDAKHLYALEDLDAGISCSAAPAKTILSLLKDPATGVSLVVPLPRPPDAPPGPSLVRYPSCVPPGGCPEPRYTGFARQKGLQGAVHILMTVTEQGTVEDATALGAIDEGLARASVETVGGWHPHAAIGPDGKPFRARGPVEVDFRLLPR